MYIPFWLLILLVLIFIPGLGAIAILIGLILGLIFLIIMFWEYIKLFFLWFMGLVALGFVITLFEKLWKKINKKIKSTDIVNQNKTTVLFICTHNSARSQMAEALLNYLKPHKYKAFSAGTTPTTVNPLTITVLEELGIDTSMLTSKSMFTFTDKKIDIVVSVCDQAKEQCPIFVNEHKSRYIHKSFQDPSNVGGVYEVQLRAFRRVRDEIKAWLLEEFR